jgi:hypothetical protein
MQPRHLDRKQAWKKTSGRAKEYPLDIITSSVSAIRQVRQHGGVVDVRRHTKAAIYDGRHFPRGRKEEEESRFAAMFDASGEEIGIRIRIR